MLGCHASAASTETVSVVQVFMLGMWDTRSNRYGGTVSLTSHHTVVVPQKEASTGPQLRREVLLGKSNCHGMLRTQYTLIACPSSAHFCTGQLQHVLPGIRLCY
jgi:hypothetical protein